MIGIGGDCFVIVMELDGWFIGFNGFGVVFCVVNLVKFVEFGVMEIEEMFLYLVMVFGVLCVWEILLKVYGIWMFKFLFKCVVEYVCDGYLVVLCVVCDWVKNVDKFVVDFVLVVWYLVDGVVFEIGIVMKYLYLVDILEVVVEGGVDVFYIGLIVEDIVVMF